MSAWTTLCGKAVALVGGQPEFKKESAILKRLVQQYGSEEVEHMLDGAKLLGWHSLKSLGSAEGLGRRLAIQRYWESVNKAPARKGLEALGAAFKRLGLT